MLTNCVRSFNHFETSRSSNAFHFVGQALKPQPDAPAGIAVNHHRVANHLSILPERNAHK